MIKKMFKKRVIKMTALVNLFALIYQLAFPLVSYGLTSGPSQPEMQSFEPVGTTDMVDLFTGNFNYNIPLLDVEGYPVNIAYHAGATVEQEASWVGLGWNINPGNINHIVRGIPDDFKGETITKELDIEAEENSRFNVFLGAEIAGISTQKVSGTLKNAIDKLKSVVGPSQIDFGINVNNYSGISASFGKSNSFRVPWISAGVNLGTTVSTSDGADFDYSLSYSSKAVGAANRHANFSVGGGMNSREGLKYRYFGVSASVPMSEDKGRISNAPTVASYSMIPIGLQNYVPVITNASSMKSYFYQVKVGGEIYMMYPFGGGSYGRSRVEYETNGSRNAYGYFNLDKATSDDITDFARDKDGRVNHSTRFLPMANMTYDIYAINGQGTGGNFRAHRNDIGTVNDPSTGSFKHEQSHLAEFGIGNLLEIGYDLKTAYTQAKSGPWDPFTRKFLSKKEDSKYEPYYFKQGGELTERNEDFFDEIDGRKTIARNVMNNIAYSNSMPDNSRTPRANLLYFLNAEEASVPQVATSPDIKNYSPGFSALPTSISRNDGTLRKKHHASEFVQVQANGQRYVYGIPAMNKVQRDFEFSCESTTSDIYTGVNYANNKPVKYDVGPVQGFYASTETPGYAHSYLLTAVLSPDYVDLTGDGITDDDLGNFTKFNYTKGSDDYGWRVPYKPYEAKYIKGIQSTCNDDKAAFSIGLREDWILHSIESRNQVAEFITSDRSDALGADVSHIFGNSGKTKSKKLDFIKLYNKVELFANPGTAVPLKTIAFSYNYTLCHDVPNSLTNDGKLTLKAISIKHGTSDIGYLSPYQFKYASNPNYSQTAKDCWGSYKPTGSNGLSLSNEEFPYVNHNDQNLDVHAAAWNLSEITLPSGGKINVTYEADDYAYVQDQEAMQMFKVEGAGPSTTFVANNTLYNDVQNPYLYIYFKRKPTKERVSGNIAKTYLGDSKIIQYTFDVEISSGTNNNGSCNVPYSENVKGYAEVIESGICQGDATYAYVKLAPKTPNSLSPLKGINLPGGNASIHPISLAAINTARYLNNKALRPQSEIYAGTSNVGKALINELLASFTSYFNFFENVLKSYIKQNKAKTFAIGKSYIRLVSPDLTKKGGGHRVKKLQFTDNWEGSTANTYGSDYSYTTTDPVTGTVISSGVASYEPLYGGDENPCRTLINTEKLGNNSKFPPVDAIELLQEGPIGESLFPPAVVGYSKVTVTSVNKNAGESSQLIQEHQYYTAYDFPVVVDKAPMDVIEKRKPKVYDILHKKEIYRVGQSYALHLNDMHGKPKRQSSYVEKYDPQNPNTPTGSKELVSYTQYDYFNNNNKTLNNDVTCLEFTPNHDEPQEVVRTLGQEIDFTMDSREKEEVTNFLNFALSVNIFVAPPFPISVPVAYPTFNKQTNIFSSLVSTKVIQQYGIMKSVSTYDKGALVTVENKAFDPLTGRALVTKVNTEYNDSEYEVKYPAYWAYKCMGAAYENILYEEKVDRIMVRNNEAYIKVKNLDDYNIGDELEFSAGNVCNGTDNRKYKLWVVDKRLPQSNFGASCISAQSCLVSANDPLKYTDQTNCYAPVDMRIMLTIMTEDPIFASLSNPDPFENVAIDKKRDNISRYVQNWKGSLCNSGFHLNEIFPGWDGYYEAVVDNSYNLTAAVPYQSSHIATVTLSRTEQLMVSRNNQNPTVNDYGVDEEFNIIQLTIRIPSNGASSTLAQNLVNNFNNKVIDGPLAGGSGSYSFLCNSIVKAFWRTRWTASVAYAPRSGYYAPQKSLVAKPIKIGAKAMDDANATWASEDDISTGKIKVIRSGKRNQLMENVQEIRSLENPIDNNELRATYNKVISSTARTFTDAAMPTNLLPSSYFNPYVTGEKGNYRPHQTYAPHAKRTYPGTMADRDKGMYSINSYWSFPPNFNDEYWGRMTGAAGSAWKVQHMVWEYSPWGTALSYRDATDVFHSNILGYGNRVPIATVTNCYQSNSLYENFEDYKELIRYQNSPLVFYGNGLKEYIKTNGGATLNGSHVKIVAGGHTGSYALQTVQNISVSIPADYAQSSIVMAPFYFESEQRHVVSCWQKVTDNNIPPTCALSITGTAANCTLYPKTQIIDGWVLYEGTTLLGTQGTTAIAINANATIDDLRIYKTTSNMKSYVYDPVFLRLTASLDENNMATIYEYSDDGKLTRVKKETEKGILTLKESRESLINLLMHSGFNYNNSN